MGKPTVEVVQYWHVDITDQYGTRSVFEYNTREEAEKTCKRLAAAYERADGTSNP